MGIKEARAALQLAIDELRNCIDGPPPGPVYTARTDRRVQEKPPLPTLGAAGFAFEDPAFHSPMWRATDQNTSVGLSCRVPSSAHATAWNCDGSKFYVVNSGGGTIVHSFDGTTITKLPHVVASQLEPQFSLVDPNLIYGVSVRTIKAWTLGAGVVDVLNLDAMYPGYPLANTYVGGLLLADHDVFVCHFGGGGIDQHVFVHHSQLGILDLRSQGWKIHATSIDRSGRFVLVYPAVNPSTGQLPVGVAQVWIWDTVAATFLPMPTRPAGHGAMGYGQFINQDCCTSGSWDASQWQIRDLAAPNTTADLISNVLTPKAIYLAEHTNWRATRPGVSVPVISASYRYGDGLNTTTYPWRAWDEEIIAIATDGSGTVWRFAHHRSTNPAEFWNQPIVHVSPNGRYAIFTSNWEGAVGANRQDVFVVELQ